MAPSRNRFFITAKGGTCLPWDIYAPVSDGLPVDCHYFGRALRQADEQLPQAGLRFHMVWDLDTVPETGSNVVVLMIGDERYQVPRYAGNVLAVFKTGALEPFAPYAGRDVNPWLKALDTARTARDIAIRARRGLPRELLRSGVFSMPLGYFQQEDVPHVPLDRRSTDVFFAGGRGPRPRLASPRTWPVRPRNVARAAMFDALDTLRESTPDLRCDTIAVATGQPPLGRRAYAERLMDAKLSLCPRGNFPETFRFFESARAGCVIVSEPLPDTWYFRDHPAVIVGSWDEAPLVITQLLSSPSKLHEIHDRTLRWWRDVASERALGRFMAARIAELMASAIPG